MKKIFILRDDQSLDRIKQGLYNELKNLILEKPKQVSITNYKEDKTAEQRGTFHALCTLFGNETGYTLPEIKEMVKKKHLGTVDVMGVEVTMSSENLKRNDYSELIEATYRLASEAGVILPIMSRHL